MTTESNNETAQEIETIKPASYFSILGNLFFSPGKAFQEVNRAPRVLWPIIGLIVVGLLGGFASSKLIDMESIMLNSQSQMEAATAQPGMTPQQAEQQAERMAVFSKFIGIASIVFTPISVLLLALIITGVVKLVSTIIGAENLFKGVFAATLYALTPYYIVYYVIFILIASFKDTSSLTIVDLNNIVGTNLGAFLSGLLGNDVLPKFVMRLCQRIDILVIWEIALLAIGYAAVSKKLKTSTAAVWISSVYAVLAIIFSAVGR